MRKAFHSVTCSTMLLATGCHNLYPEDVASLQAYQTQNLEMKDAHIRAAFCNEEAVERRHAAGQLDTPVIVCTPARK
jgi:hypothetical protein